jgi:hypothetical protein
MVMVMARQQTHAQMCCGFNSSDMPMGGGRGC